jgi:hypothetical protein
MAKPKHRIRKVVDRLNNTIELQSCHFLTLPVEVRTQGYRAALLKLDAINLWPHKAIDENEFREDYAAL